MGGAVSAVTDVVGDVVGGVGGIASGVAGAIPGVGPVLGPVVGGITGGPIGFASSLASQAIQGNYGGGGGGGGGGGAPTYGSTNPGAAGSGTTTPFYSPTYNYGANSYSVDSKPFDTSKYFIQGNKGSYNVLPQLANLYDPSTQQRAGAPSANIYNDIIGQFSQNQDTLAQQNFQKNFGLQTYNPNVSNPTALASDFNAPDYLKSDIQNALGEYYPGGTGPGTVPVNYADFGFKSGDTLQKIADYAKKENNPFFMPYAPENVIPEIDTRPPTIMPVSSNPQVAQPLRYTPSQDARGPAPRDLAPASVASSGSFRPAETGSTTARTAAPAAPGMFKPVNIRTGGLASLRRK
jgi:hypothetical protein